MIRESKYSLAPYNSSEVEKKIKVKSNTSKSQYINMVKKAKKFIKIGDIFQVVLSQRFEAKLTKKPLEVRQGKGKGSVEYWVALIQPGKVLYEMQGVTEEVAREALGLAAAKLPFKTTFVSRTAM